MLCSGQIKRLLGWWEGSLWLDAEITPQTICRGLDIYLLKVMQYLHVWFWFSSTYWVDFVIGLRLAKNNSRHFCSSFVRFWDREAYQWRLVPHKCLGDLATSRTNQVAQLWPGNQSSQSQCPAVTLQPWHGTATCATMIISQQPPVTSHISACLLRSKNRLWLQRMSFFVKW